MTKPTFKHVSAITRSIHLLQSGLDDELEKRFHKPIERDMILVKQVRAMLLKMIENPTLPFTEQSANAEPAKLEPLSEAPNESW